MRYRIELEIDENGDIVSIYQNEKLFRSIIDIAVGKEVIGMNGNSSIYNLGIEEYNRIIKPEPLINLSVGQKITDGVNVWVWQGPQMGTAGCYLHSEYIKE